MDTDSTRLQAIELLAKYDVKLSAVFVPQSMSRNSQEKEHTINWRITLASSRGAFAFDYQQGIGHVPNYRTPRTLWDEQLMGQPWETGRYNASEAYVYIRRLEPPSAADILHCLMLDMIASHTSFENWCDECGYDSDSRKAERIYHACAQQTESAYRVLGHALIAEATKLLEDY